MTTHAQHTPGPPRIVRAYDPASGKRTEYTCGCLVMEEGTPTAPYIVFCLLHHAAPELLAALKDAVDEVLAWRRKHPHDHPHKPVVTSGVLDNARAAIRKAIEQEG